MHPTRNRLSRETSCRRYKTGKRTLVDDCGKGWHSATLSENGQYVFDNYSTPTVPRKIALVNTENGKRTAYFTAENPWKGYNVPEYSCGTIKAADGETDLYWRMVKPVNFDPNKKYPTIIYVYGGPHAHNVDARWNYSSRGWETYMAERAICSSSSTTVEARTVARLSSRLPSVSSDRLRCKTR